MDIKEITNFLETNITEYGDYTKIIKEINRIGKKNRIKKIINFIIENHKNFNGTLDGTTCIQQMKKNNIIISRNFFYRILNLLKTKKIDDVIEELTHRKKTFTEFPDC